MTTTIKTVTENGDTFKGIVVSSDVDGGCQEVIVKCDYPPLAIELLKHAIVAMEEHHNLRQWICRNDA